MQEHIDLQSPYCAFTHSLCHEWSYLRVVGGYDNEYFCLRDTIQHALISAVLGREVLEKELVLFTLPVKLGDLGLKNSMKSASSAFSISKEATSVLQGVVRTGKEVVVAEHTTSSELLCEVSSRRKRRPRLS